MALSGGGEVHYDLTSIKLLRKKYNLSPWVIYMITQEWGRRVLPNARRQEADAPRINYFWEKRRLSV